MAWQCFMLEPTEIARRYLRRFTYGTKNPCPQSKYGGHHAETPIENGKVIIAADGTYTIDDDVANYGPECWPTQCECGYVFTDEDEWQVSGQQLWKAPDGNLYTIIGWEEGGAPAGAMWDAAWFHDVKDWVGPDGKSLNVMLPDGTPWLIDGPSRTGGKWTRTGTPPNITVSPSILTSNYHGFLQNGWLTDDLDGNLTRMKR